MLPLLLLPERKGPAMNANQVVIVMDREAAQADVERLGVSRDTLKGNPPLVLDALRAALDRDPDLETLIAAALEPIPFRCEDPGCCDKQRERARSQAQAVLHALQEGTEK